MLLNDASNAELWTRKDVEKAHVLYLNDVMAALIEEQRRFTSMIKGNLLRDIKPVGCAHLDRGSQLPDKFESPVLIKEKTPEHHQNDKTHAL